MYRRTTTRRKWIAFFLVVAAAVAAPFVVSQILPPVGLFLEKWQAWYGVLVGFGGLVFVTWAQFSYSREQARREGSDKTRSLARALYFEVYNRAARGALDAQTWRGFLRSGTQIDLSRFRKFRPSDPVVFPTLGSDIAMLPDKALAPLIMFYFRLDAVRRDVDKDPELDEQRNLEAHEVQLFERRLRETLQPAVDTLNALGDLLPDRADIDQELNAAHAEFLESRDLRLVLRALLSP